MYKIVCNVKDLQFTKLEMTPIYLQTYLNNDEN